MSMAYTISPKRGDADQLLSQLADTLQRQGIRPHGIVQTNTECLGGGPCDMDVRVLPNGPVIRISQSLGAGSRGCRLDPAALEQAVGLVDATLSQTSDILIVNKFGKHEADGRGFRDVMAKAALQDVLLLVGLNQLNRDAFLAFAGGMAVEVPSDLKALAHWCSTEVGVRRQAA